MEIEKKYISNTIIIGSNRIEDLNRYEHAVLVAMSPMIYEKYGCIKIQATFACLDLADWVVKNFRNAGLEEINRERKDIEVTNSKTGEKYTLEIIEITLHKHPALRHK